MTTLTQTSFLVRHENVTQPVVGGWHIRPDSTDDRTVLCGLDESKVTHAVAGDLVRGWEPETALCPKCLAALGERRRSNP